MGDVRGAYCRQLRNSLSQSVNKNVIVKLSYRLVEKMSFYQIMQLMSLRNLRRAYWEGEGGERPSTASEETITKLETGTAEALGVAGDTCPIRMIEFDKDDEVTKLPCGHAFAKQPIETWLREKKAQCPSCRATLVGADQDQEQVMDQEQDHAAIALGHSLERQLLLHTMGVIVASQMEGEEDTADLQWAIASSIEYNALPPADDPPLSPG